MGVRTGDELDGFISEPLAPDFTARTNLLSELPPFPSPYPALGTLTYGKLAEYFYPVLQHEDWKENI